jgi:catechol 2,3-dioxygenase-like lactoylglutathione lyase family enzyme
VPRLTGLLETALYVDDLDRSIDFYASLFTLPMLVRDERFCAFSVGERQVLLLFKRGATTSPLPTPGGVIPPHDGAGPLHMAFAIERGDVDAWAEVLRSRGVTLESRVTWARGGESLYFRDPDHHLIELATPGIWAIR